MISFCSNKLKQILAASMIHLDGKFLFTLVMEVNLNLLKGSIRRKTFLLKYLFGNVKTVECTFLFYV